MLGTVLDLRTTAKKEKRRCVGGGMGLGARNKNPLSTGVSGNLLGPYWRKGVGVHQRS